MSRAVRLWAVGAIGAGLLIGCGGTLRTDDGSVTPASTESSAAAGTTAVQSTLALSDLRTFGDYPVLWIGEEFQGMKLTSVERFVTDFPADARMRSKPLSERSSPMQTGRPQ